MTSTPQEPLDETTEPAQGTGEDRAEEAGADTGTDDYLDRDNFTGGAGDPRNG